MSRKAAWAFPSRATPNLSTQGPFGTGPGLGGGQVFDRWISIQFLGSLRCFNHVFYFCRTCIGKGGPKHWRIQQLWVLRDHQVYQWQRLEVGQVAPGFFRDRQPSGSSLRRNPSGSGSLVGKPPATTGWKSVMHGSSVRRSGREGKGGPCFWARLHLPKSWGFVKGILSTIVHQEKGTC